MHTTTAPAPRPIVGSIVRVRAIQSERRGETGTVVAVSPTRAIYTVAMEAGDTAQWPLFELAIID